MPEPCASSVSSPMSCRSSRLVQMLRKTAGLQTCRLQIRFCEAGRIGSGRFLSSFRPLIEAAARVAASPSSPTRLIEPRTASSGIPFAGGSPDGSSAAALGRGVRKLSMALCIRGLCYRTTSFG